MNVIRSMSMYQVKKKMSKEVFHHVLMNFRKAAMDGNELYFDAWLLSMKSSGFSMTSIKSQIEKLDQEQYSVLHYAIRYHHLNLSRKLIEEFHCGIQSSHILYSLFDFSNK